MNLDRICALCAAEGSNLSKLERDCGLSNAAIRRWENSSPSAENIQKVAEHFGVSIDYLLGRDSYAVSNDALACAKQFDVLPDDKKQLVKVYMSVVSAQ